MSVINTRPKKKYTDLIAKEKSPDPELFLVTTGPAGHVWSLHTISNHQMIELVPIFNTENKILELLELLQDRSLQAISIQLSRAVEFFQDKDVLFMFNPKITDFGSPSTFKEGPGWKVSLQDLQPLILANSLNRKNNSLPEPSDLN